MDTREIRGHSVLAASDTPIHNLTLRMLDDFDGQMRRAESTVRQCHAILRRAFQQAMRWEWIDRNPVTYVLAPRAEVSTP